MTSSEIRRSFIDFFVRKHGHTFVPSSPVVPLDDPTLLFTNAGMNQFKPIFLGTERRDYTRAVNSQKCIRAGGKHNDLEDVGRSRRHHTFFEMLGNWSFGDYFKEGAIRMAWELLVDVWKLDPTRIHVSVHDGDPANGVPRDEEAADIWHRIIGIPRERIHYGGKDNFWEMGETGPCGPCTEIFYDRTPDKSGGPSVLTGTDPRVMEIWNNVFVQYNRNPDRSLTKLPAQHVDTGMGFERICQVLQGKTDNYAIDLFEPIFKEISRLSNQTYGGLFPASDQGDRSNESPELKRDIAFRVIADHARMATFAITDGARPDNKGRDSVVRSVIRRAVRFGYQQFGLREPFLFTLVPIIAKTMGDIFPELHANASRVAQIIEGEEKSFLATIERGLSLFEEASRAGSIGAADAFDLHTTFGFPIDLTTQIASERGISVDVAGYEKLFEEFKEQSAAGRKSVVQTAVDLSNVPATDDSAKYDSLELAATVVGRFDGNDGVVSLLLDRTCFYGEQGGQVGDTGVIESKSAVFAVHSTQRLGEHVLHVGTFKSGNLAVGDAVTARVSPARAAIVRNHTATHLANWALRETLGEAVQQKGSLVDAEKLRFDFSHDGPLTDEQAAKVETLVRDSISKKLRVHTLVSRLEEAMKINGLRAVFGEKYPAAVRVVSIGAPVEELLAAPSRPDWRAFSVEFCGGTHVKSTDEIGPFTLVADESVSKGVRRIVALTGERAAVAIKAGDQLRSRIDEARTIDESQLAARLAQIQKDLAADALPLLVKRDGQKTLAELQAKLKAWEKQQKKSASIDVAAVAEELVSKSKSIGGIDVIIGSIDGVDGDQLRSIIDSIRKRRESFAANLLSVEGDKVTIVAGASDAAIARGLKAGDWVRETAKACGGGGGGRPNLAQAGGKDPAKVPDALAAAEAFAAGVLTK